MSFGSDLQGWQSHEALLHLQDYEVNLLDGIRKCISHRAKCDKEYVSSLGSLISSISQKLYDDVNEQDTPLSQVWSVIMAETDSALQLMRQYADQLGSALLDTAVQVVNEKKLLRKMYAEKRTSMEMELDRLLDEASKSKERYQQRLVKLVQNRIKYETMWKKGRSSSKLEEIKANYIRSENKVRNAHNCYLVALCEVNLYQQQYSHVMLPSLLSVQQNLQENLVKLCKQVLEQFATVTDWSNKCFQDIQENIKTAIRSINHTTEYREFVNRNRTEPVKFSAHEFEQSIVTSCVPNSILTRGQIVVDEATVDNLRYSKICYNEELTKCRQRLSSKQLELRNTEQASASDPSTISGHIGKRTVEVLRREIIELHCLEEKCVSVLHLIEPPLEELANARPPSCISPLSDFGSLPLESEGVSESPQQQLPNVATGGSPNIKQTLSNIRSSITTKIQLRRGRNSTSGGGGGGSSGATAASILPSPETIDAFIRNPTAADSGRDSHTSSEQQRQQETSRSAAVAVILNDTSTSRYAASEFVPRQSSPAQKTTASSPQKSFQTANDVAEVADRAVVEQMDGPGSVSVAPQAGRLIKLDSVVLEDRDEIVPEASGGSAPAGAEDAIYSLQQRSSYLSPDQFPVDNEGWYHGVLPRDDVQSLLVNNGDFLVRVSSNKRTGKPQYVLSVKWGVLKHFILQDTPEGGIRLDGVNYQSLHQMIHHLLSTGQPVTRKSGAVLRAAVPRHDWELENDDIDLQMKIGSGQFGEVYRGMLKSAGLTVAVKTCRESIDEDVKKKFLQEARILKQYDHPNIVRFIGVATQRPPVMIVMEFVPGGSLLSFLRKHGSQQTAKTLVKMCEDAAGGMVYLSSRKCIHRDLAARNCLVGDNCVIKISDFGMSRQEHEYVITSGQRHIPIKWTAPEAVTYGTYTSACDVWSFGVLMWEVFSFGSMPYPGLTNSQAVDKINEGYRMPPPAEVPDSLYELMMQCWEQEPEDRPTFDVVYNKLQLIRDTV